MNVRRTVSLGLFALFTLPAWIALAQKTPAPAANPGRTSVAAPGQAGGPAVARVGSVSLSKSELDSRTEQALRQYRQSSGDRELPREMTDLLRRQMLENMIRLQILSFEADRTGARGSLAEAEEALKQSPVFNPGGRFDPDRYQALKTTQRAAWDEAIEALRRQLGARKVYASLEARLAPTDSEVRTAVTRQLSRALVDHLSLRLGDFDGGYPEPREGRIRDWYDAHREEYRRPDRATVTVCFVNSPGLPDSLRDSPARVEAWTRQLRQIADGIQARLSAGVPFDSATRSLPERVTAEVQPDNFPGYWRGSPAQSAAVFDPRQTGRTLPEPIRAAEGWMLVRVDQLVPSHVVPLREVARDIRAALRRDTRLHHDEYEQRELYAASRDSLAGTGWKLRYVAIDTARVRVEEPNAAELDRWYRGHLAEYSSFDPATGSIRSQPFAEVRDEVRRRLVQEARARQGRALAEQLQRSWAAGKRDRSLESPLPIRETGPVIPGSIIDTGLVASAVGDTLRTLGEPRGAEVIPYARGWIVWTAVERVDRVIPTFEQARPALVARLRQRKARAELDGARRLFTADSMRFNRGPLVHFTRFSVAPPPLLSVPLTRDEVEKWRHDHMDDYSAPELVTARHILIRTRGESPEEDRAARAKAEEILRRAQAGEDFQLLARTYSEDPATRDVGGDLGAFGRGAMLKQFEQAAFAMSAGDLSEQPVKTEVGYHIIKCTDHVPAYVQPLPLIYTNVAADAAQAKAIEIARARADSLLAATRSPAALVAAARRMGWQVLSQSVPNGSDLGNPEVQPFYDRLYKSPLGQVATPPHYVRGDGFWIGWSDSLAPPVAPTWAQAREQALAEYRRGAGRRSLDAKRAELDSMLASGWTLDSLGTLWGGLEHALDVMPARGLTGMGASAELDSLVFGGRGGEGLAVGEETGWIDLPAGITRMRLVDRVPPASDQFKSRAAALRAAELERRLRSHFDELKRRYPVRILDPVLRDVSLAEPPPGLDP